MQNKTTSIFELEKEAHKKINTMDSQWRELNKTGVDVVESAFGVLCGNIAGLGVLVDILLKRIERLEKQNDGQL